jgi:hypothetical protein
MITSHLHATITAAMKIADSEVCVQKMCMYDVNVHSIYKKVT